MTKNTLLAPNGQPSNLNETQYNLVRTTEFKNWFGDWENNPNEASKVVDSNGEPLVVHHGSPNKFNEFDKKKIKSGFHGIGFYFSKEDMEYGKNIYKCFLNIRNPFDINGDYSVKEIKNILGKKYSEIEGLVKSELEYSFNNKVGGFVFYSYSGNELLKKSGYDGLFHSDIYVAFEPNQIKLADGTNITFNPESNDIRFKDGGLNNVLIAPNGKPSNLNEIQYNLVRTPEFKNWFGDWENNPTEASKIVDENGEPLVAYHGTNRDFNVFDSKEITSNSGNAGHYGEGFYFSFEIAEAKTYTDRDNPKILNCFLNIRNPFDAFNIQHLERYSEEFGFEKKNVAIDSDWMKEQLKSKDLMAYDMYSLVLENGYEKGWELFLEKYPRGQEAKFDLNDISNLATEWSNKDSDSELSDFVMEFLETNFKEEPKLIKNYTTGDEPRMIYMTDYGQSTTYITKLIQKDGFDGIVAGSEIVLFKSNQIKIADGTNITFNPDSNDIRFEDGGLNNVLIAPNGKPSNLNEVQYNLVRTTKFKNWFGDWENSPENSSKALDVNGEPLVVYHGSDNDFNEFKNKNPFTRQNGFFFSSNKNVAKLYGNILKPYFISIKKINNYDAKGISFGKAIDEIPELENDLIQETPSIDGVIVEHIYDHPNGKSEIDISTTYCVFDSKNIKLADGKNTIFDTSKTDVRYDNGGSIENNKMEEEKNITLDKVKNTPAGGVLIGEREGQTIIPKDGTMGGFLIGNLHKENGIKAVNKSNGQPLEMQGNEVVITAPAVADQTKRQFEGKLMTNREILSKINSDGGGVSFADGGEIPAKINISNKEYDFEGQTINDVEISHLLGCNSTLQNGKQLFTHNDTTYDVAGIYHAITYHEIEYNLEYVDSFPMKYSIYDKKYSENISPDFSKPQGLMIQLPNGEKVLIDGNHRMDNAYVNGFEKTMVYYINDVNEISKFCKNNSFASGGKLNTKKIIEEQDYYPTPPEIVKVLLESENKGGHLSNNMSLEDIAKLHDVSLFHITQQLAMGLEVEKEHTSDENERIKIAKDHLVENPDYYTILDKAGLELGGGLPIVVYNERYQDYRIKVFKNKMPRTGKQDNFSFVICEFINDEWQDVYNGKSESTLSKAVEEAEAVIKTNEEAKNVINTNSFAKGGKLDLAKEAKNGTTPSRDLDSYNDVLDVHEDGIVGNHQDFNDNYAGSDASVLVNGDGSGVSSVLFEDGGELEEEDDDDTEENEEDCDCEEEEDFFADGGDITGSSDEEKLKQLLNQKIKYETITTRSKKYPFLQLYKYKDYGVNFGFKNKEDKITIASKELVLCNDFDFKAPYYFICYEPSKHGQIANTVLITTDYKTLTKAIADIFDAEYADCYVYKNNTSEFVDVENIDSIYQIYPKDEIGVVIDKWLKNIYDYDYKTTIQQPIIKPVMNNDKNNNKTTSIVDNWNNVPSVWKDTSKVKKVTWINSPYDKGLYSILEPFIGKDNLRPNMEGINFDENGITATDAHKLITLPYPNSKFNGIYKADLSKRKSENQITIDGEYPKYEILIPEYKKITKSCKISVYKLLQYTKVAVKYANKVTNQVNFKLGEDKIAFSGNYLNECLTSLLKLGHETIWFHYIKPNAPIIFSLNKEYEFGNSEIVLLMPVYLSSDYLGALDMDYDRELSVYYDFATDEIYNADGSVAEFKMNYKNNVVVSEEDVKLLSKLTSEKKHSNTTAMICVENKTAKAVSDEFKDWIRIKDIDLSEGLYNVVGNVLESTITPVEDYPETPVFEEDDKTIEFTIDSEILEYYFDKLKLAVGKDDLRPVMKGILLHYTSDNRLYLVATDAHIMLKIELTDYVTIGKYDFEAKYILNPKYINILLDNVENHSLFISSNRKATLIECAKADLYTENIVGNYPNYNAIIPYFLDKKITFSLADIKKCINGEKVKSYTKSLGSKYATEVIFSNENKLMIGNSASTTGGVIENVEDLCDIDVNTSNEEYQYRSDSVLLAMPFLDRSKEYDFAFKKSDLTRITDIIVDEKVVIHYKEQNQAYLIPIHSISFDKTKKESKKSEQKPTQKEIDAVVKEETRVRESNEIDEAVDVLRMLSESASDEERTEIEEALEVLEMLQDNDNSFEDGGSIDELKSSDNYISNEFGNTSIETPLDTFSDKNSTTPKHNEITIEFLNSIDSKTKNEILSNIANHYGITKESAYEEITDEEAESLMDYITGEIRPAISLLFQKYKAKK